MNAPMAISGRILAFNRTVVFMVLIIDYMLELSSSESPGFWENLAKVVGKTGITPKKPSQGLQEFTSPKG